MVTYPNVVRNTTSETDMTQHPQAPSNGTVLNPNAVAFQVNTPATPPTEVEDNGAVGPLPIEPSLPPDNSAPSTLVLQDMPNCELTVVNNDLPQMNGGDLAYPPRMSASAAPVNNPMPMADYSGMNGLPMPVMVDGSGGNMNMGDLPSHEVTTPVTEEMTPTDILEELVRTQMEYYFSRENLLNDSYLNSQMDKDQYVFIATIAGFNKIKQHTSDLELITKCLRDSPVVQVNEEGTKVRPMLHRCIVILREIPKTTPKADVQNLFAAENCPDALCVDYIQNSIWFVTFASDDEAHVAYDHLREVVKVFQGKPIHARIKSKQPIARRAPYNAAKNGYKPNNYDGNIIYNQGMHANANQPPHLAQTAQPAISHDGDLATSQPQANIVTQHQQQQQQQGQAMIAQASLPLQGSQHNASAQAVVSQHGSQHQVQQSNAQGIVQVSNVPGAQVLTQQGHIPQGQAPAPFNNNYSAGLASPQFVMHGPVNPTQSTYPFFQPGAAMFPTWPTLFDPSQAFALNGYTASPNTPLVKNNPGNQMQANNNTSGNRNNYQRRTPSKMHGNRSSHSSSSSSHERHSGSNNGGREHHNNMDRMPHGPPFNPMYDRQTNGPPSGGSGGYERLSGGANNASHDRHHHNNPNRGHGSRKDHYHTNNHGGNHSNNHHNSYNNHGNNMNNYGGNSQSGNFGGSHRMNHGIDHQLNPHMGHPLGHMSNAGMLSNTSTMMVTRARPEHHHHHHQNHHAQSGGHYPHPNANHATGGAGQSEEHHHGGASNQQNQGKEHHNQANRNSSFKNRRKREEQQRQEHGRPTAAATTQAVPPPKDINLGHTNFPPLPGAPNESADNKSGKSAPSNPQNKNQAAENFENKMSDVVKGTVRVNLNEDGSSGSDSVSPPPSPKLDSATGGVSNAGDLPVSSTTTNVVVIDSEKKNTDAKESDEKETSKTPEEVTPVVTSAPQTVSSTSDQTTSTSMTSANTPATTSLVTSTTTAPSVSTTKPQQQKTAASVVAQPPKPAASQATRSQGASKSGASNVAPPKSQTGKPAASNKNQQGSSSAAASNKNQQGSSSAAASNKNQQGSSSAAASNKNQQGSSSAAAPSASKPAPKEQTHRNAAQRTPAPSTKSSSSPADKPTGEATGEATNGPVSPVDTKPSYAQMATRARTAEKPKDVKDTGSASEGEAAAAAPPAAREAVAVEAAATNGPVNAGNTAATNTRGALREQQAATARSPTRNAASKGTDDGKERHGNRNNRASKENRGDKSDRNSYERRDYNHRNDRYRRNDNQRYNK